MSKVDHYMPLWIADYLADTTRLNTEQHGAYLLLLFDYWRNGAPPIDDEILMQITKLDKKKWIKNKPVLIRFFEQKDGVLIHKRVEKEIKKSRDKKEANIERAKAGAEARWGKSNDSSSNALSNAKSINKAEQEEQNKQSTEYAILEPELIANNSAPSQEGSGKPPISPKGGTPAAASFGNDEEDIDSIIERIVKIRTDASKRNGRPVKNPFTLKQSLVMAYKKDPQGELTGWKEQIAYEDAEEEKREAKRLLDIETRKKQAKEEEEKQKAKAELDAAMSEYENLSQDDQDELWEEAERIEKEGCPNGIKPFRPMIERRVVSLMRKRGIIEGVCVE